MGSHMGWCVTGPDRDCWTQTAAAIRCESQQAANPKLDANCNLLRIVAYRNLLRIAVSQLAANRNKMRTATGCPSQQPVANRNSLLRSSPCSAGESQAPPTSASLVCSSARGGPAQEYRPGRWNHPDMRGHVRVGAASSVRFGSDPGPATAYRRAAAGDPHFAAGTTPGGRDQEPPAGAEILTGAAPPGKLRFFAAGKRAGLDSQ